MARVSYSTMFSGPRAALHTIIDNRSYVGDPLQVSTTSKRKMVYAREPDVKSIGFAGYPYIIVRPSTGRVSKRTANMKSGEAEFGAEIEVVSSDRGNGSSDGQGMAHMDAISDDIAETFNNATVRNSLRTSDGLALADLDSTDVGDEDVHSTKVFRRSFFLQLKVRMAVST